MRKNRLIALIGTLTIALGALLSFGTSLLKTKNISSVLAAEGKATKDYPVIVNCYGDVNNFFNDCDAGIHCWGGDLESSVTVKVDKLTEHMGTAIIPKGTQYMKVVRARSGLLPCDGWPSTVHNEFGQWSFDSTKNVITIKKWSGEQHYSEHKEIFLANKPVMFDVDSSVANWWWNDNCTSYLNLDAVSGWYDYTVSESWNKLTRIGTSGYMYFIPSDTLIATRGIVTRNKENSSGWNNKYNQTTDMTTNYGFNPLYTTQIENSTSDSKQNWGNKSAVETASEFGFYLNSIVTCDGNGSITSELTKWSDAETFYNNLTANVQGECWLAQGNEAGNNIEQAMLRYDYIGFHKQYNGYNDFINWGAEGSGRVISSSAKAFLFDTFSENSNSLIFVIFSLIAVSSVGVFFIYRKHKEN